MPAEGGERSAKWDYKTQKQLAWCHNMEHVRLKGEIERLKEENTRLELYIPHLEEDRVRNVPYWLNFGNGLNELWRRVE